MKCFLSYSYLTDISVIKKILAEHKVSYVNLVESLEYGNPIVSTIASQMMDSDFIISIFDESTSVSVELGIATLSRKPVFVIVDEKVERPLPNFIEAFTYTIAKPTDYENIKDGLDIFLRNLPNKKYKTGMNVSYSGKRIRKKEYKGKKLSKEDIQEFGDINNKRGLEFEELVGELFKKLNFEIFAQNKTKERDFQADYSLWIDELNPIIGNPLIIETKSTSDTVALNAAMHKLSMYLKKYNSKVGLLIYSQPTGEPLDTLFSYNPLVLSISIQELVIQLTQKTFPEIILQLRNKAVHKEIY